MSNRVDPTLEERAEAEREIREFMASQQEVPESERTVISNEKYDGPIGEPRPGPRENRTTYSSDQD